MRKILLIISIMLFTNMNSIVFGDIKDSIVIVNPIYNQTIIDSFIDKSEKFRKEGSIKLSETFKNFTIEGYGSGFVIEAPDGEQYIITNKHVVANADSVTIKDYDNVEIVYIDRTVDLALIQIPGKKFSDSFTFYNEGFSDGDDVWAAGYPGLLGEPGWQFSKGNITNREAKLAYMEGSSISYLIQHSASIDPGNSGGPLLIKNALVNMNYSVIGVNTFSVTNRNNTFFAIPSVDVISFFNKALEAKQSVENEQSMRESLISSIDDFIIAIHAEEPNQRFIISYFSNQLVGDVGLDSYYHVLDRSGNSLKDKWRDSFYYDSPFNTIRGAIYERFMTIKNNSIEFIEIKSITNDSTWEARTILRIGGKKVKVDWAFNFGFWQIKEMDFGSLTLGFEGEDLSKKLIPKYDKDISPAYMNLALPGLTQIQREKMSGITYAITAVGGFLLFADSILELSDGHYVEGSSFASAELSIGISLYLATGLFSFLEEVLE